jgi:hypothetical protein
MLSGRGMPEYMMVDDERGKPINMSPGSDTFERGPGMAVAFEIKEGQGSSSFTKIKRNYAQLVHPVKSKDVEKIAPELIDRRPMGIETDEQGQIVRRFEVFLKDFSVGSEKEVVSGPEATDAIANALAEGTVDLPAVRFNKNFLKKLRSLQASLGSVVRIPDSHEWYKKRIGNVTNISDLQTLDSHLRMTYEEFCPERVIGPKEKAFVEAWQIQEELTRQLSNWQFMDQSRVAWADLSYFRAELHRAEIELSARDTSYMDMTLARLKDLRATINRKITGRY